MPLTIEQSETSCLLRLQGEINIDAAVELKKLLIETLSSGKGLCLDVESATDLDVTALQLFCAAEREARGLGVRFTLAGSLPANIALSVKDSGFDKFPVPVGAK